MIFSAGYGAKHTCVIACSILLILSYCTSNAQIAKPQKKVKGEQAAVLQHADNADKDVQDDDLHVQVAEWARTTDSLRTVLTKRYGKKIADDLLALKIWKGMTDQMLQYVYGEPRMIQRMKAAPHDEGWLYSMPARNCPSGDCPPKLYWYTFVNHKLTEVQED